MYKRDIYLDIDDNLNNYIKSVELDSDSRVWHFHLTVDYEPLDLTGKSVQFRAEKPDKTNVLNDCKIVDAEKGVVEVKLTRQVNAIPGHVKCLLKIIGDEEFVLTTKTFVVDVSKTLSDDAIVSSDEFGALEAALGKVQDIDNRFAQTNAQLSQKTSYSYVDEKINQIVSGSPNGVYANLNALKLAKPNGDVGIYITSDDGQWNYWNGSEWVSGGIYQSQGVGERSVGIRETKYLMAAGVASKNLFDKTDLLINKQANYITGNIETASGKTATQFIEVPSDTSMQLHEVGSGSDVAYYDEDKSFISGKGNATGGFTTPSNCKYVRITTNYNKIETQMLEIGDVKSQYTDGLPKTKLEDKSIETKHIVDKSISKDLIDFEVLDLRKSTNLYNKLTSIDGKYINFLNGKVESASGFRASAFIEVEPSTEYIKSTNKQLAFYDENQTYLSGITDGVTNFTTPSNCKYVRLTLNNADNDTFILNKGAELLPYESFEPKIKSENFGNSSIPKSALDFTVAGLHKNIIVVDCDGNGDFLTINEALKNISDSVDRKYTLVIMPGEYIESVKLIGRYVTLYGVNRDECVIKTYTNDYHNPPIDLSTNSHIYNLTIIADENEDTTTSSLNAYAIHFDIAGRGYNINDSKYQGISRIKNCNLISKNYMALGIGSGNKQHLIIEDCDIYSTKTSTITLHSYLPSGATNQKVTFNNCKIHTDANNGVITIYDANWKPGLNGGQDSTDTVFTFAHNIFWSEILGHTNLLGRADYPAQENGCISGYIKLGVGSYGNNIDDLNFK